jgi:hypothetical protein
MFCRLGAIVAWLYILTKYNQKEALRSWDGTIAQWPLWGKLVALPTTIWPPGAPLPSLYAVVVKSIGFGCIFFQPGPIQQI